MYNHTSISKRQNQLFLRNQYAKCGQFGFPLVSKQELNVIEISLIACSDTRSHDCRKNTCRGVHFFADDDRFEGIYRNPKRSLKKLAQYALVLTPDFSTYANMDPWRQIESIAHSRRCGAYWQEHGLTVFPTVTWSTPTSYRYCFDGIEKGSTVAVGMIGCKRSKANFLRGYNAMLKKIQPSSIICFGDPFPEMQGNIITVDYCASRKAVR